MLTCFQKKDIINGDFVYKLRCGVLKCFYNIILIQTKYKLQIIKRERERNGEV